MLFIHTFIYMIIHKLFHFQTTKEICERCGNKLT